MKRVDPQIAIFQSSLRSAIGSADSGDSDVSEQTQVQWEKVRSKFKEVSTEIVIQAVIGPKRVLWVDLNNRLIEEFITSGIGKYELYQANRDPLMHLPSHTLITLY